MPRTFAPKNTLKKLGTILMHILFSPFYLMMAIGLAAFGFMGCAGQDVSKRGPKVIFLVLTIPAIIGWVIVGLQLAHVYQFDGWIGILLSLLYGLVALYAFFSLDRLEPAIRETFPTLSEKKIEWLFYGLLALNLPIILAIFGSISSRYE